MWWAALLFACVLGAAIAMAVVLGKPSSSAPSPPALLLSCSQAKQTIALTESFAFHALDFGLTPGVLGIESVVDDMPAGDAQAFFASTGSFALAPGATQIQVYYNCATITREILCSDFPLFLDIGEANVLTNTGILDATVYFSTSSVVLATDETAQSYVSPLVSFSCPVSPPSGTWYDLVCTYDGGTAATIETQGETVYVSNTSDAWMSISLGTKPVIDTVGLGPGETLSIDGQVYPDFLWVCPIVTPFTCVELTQTLMPPFAGRVRNVTPVSVAFSISQGIDTVSYELPSQGLSPYLEGIDTVVGLTCPSLSVFDCGNDVGSQSGVGWGAQGGDPLNNSYDYYVFNAGLTLYADVQMFETPSIPSFPLVPGSYSQAFSAALNDGDGGEFTCGFAPIPPS